MSFLQEAISKASDRLAEWFDLITEQEATAADGWQANAEDRDAVAVEIVRWVGGPFDGLETEVDRDAIWYLHSALEIPVSAATLESSAPLSTPPPDDRPTSLALYGLSHEEGDWVYRFEAQVSAP